ncbi:MAG: radical SAM protein, partial [Clostridiales bacterium]|nr:radical SAM protein [Clostridiales bacterium]
MDALTYKVGNGLYVNMTNRCTMNCTFCIRSHYKGVGDAPTLWLSKEYTKEEILKDILKQDLSKFVEIVFCGFGEPTERLHDLLWICKELKQIKNSPHEDKKTRQGELKQTHSPFLPTILCGGSA